MSARKWTIRGLAGAALLACATGSALAQAPAATPAATASRPAAVVNGEPIPMADLEAMIRMAGPQPSPLTEQAQRELRDDALEMLVEDVLWHQFLRQYAPAASAEQIAQELAKMEQALKEKKKTLQEYYKETGQSEAQCRTNIGYLLQWTAYCNAKVSDAMVKQYYDTYKEFFDKVTVRASHIMIHIPSKANGDDVAEARARLTNLRQQVVEGKIDFPTAAKKYSQDTLTAPQGGDIGFFPRKGVMEETIAKTAFALKPGELSEVVQTEMGLHLILVTERNPGTPSDFESKRDDARMFCIMEMQQNIVTQLRKAAKIEKSW
jgi:parvulin-like peptidyl-prolyl isomerase